MKILIKFILLLSTTSAYSQAILKDDFKIGNFIEVFGGDSLKVYFNCTGTIVDKNCASFYRVGKIDSTVVNFTDTICDYTIDNKLYFKATIKDNDFNGYACYYYTNGAISEEGYFKNNTRVGKWSFYYPNKQLQKIYQYQNDEILVLEAYKSNGKAVVENGTGKFNTEFRNFKQCSSFETSGKVINGRKTGEWSFSNIGAIQPIAYEKFDDGKFIEGNSNGYIYTTNPKISFYKFYPNEELGLFENDFGCPGDNFFNWTYNDGSVFNTYYPSLENALNKSTSIVPNQWLIVGLTINKNDMQTEIKIHSSISDIKTENIIYDLINKMTLWKTAILNSKKIESNIYFSILVSENKFIIVPLYVFKNRGY